jgi:hypothetical protein
MAGNQGTSSSCTASCQPTQGHGASKYDQYSERRPDCSTIKRVGLFQAKDTSRMYLYPSETGRNLWYEQSLWTPFETFTPNSTLLTYRQAWVCVADPDRDCVGWAEHIADVQASDRRIECTQLQFQCDNVYCNIARCFTGLLVYASLVEYSMLEFVCLMSSTESKLTLHDAHIASRAEIRVGWIRDWSQDADTQVRLFIG